MKNRYTQKITPVLSVNDWPEQERPLYKICERGSKALSDAELLSLFIGKGTKDKTVVDLARDILKEFGGLRPLLNADQSTLTKHTGIGATTFARLQAILELSRRHLLETLQKDDCLNSPHLTRQYLSAQLRDEKREVFAALWMDNQHRIICYEILFTGTIDSAAIYPREVVRRCLELNATAVIFAHNHPSGVAEPSQADRKITERLQATLKLIDVKVLDHFVVGDGCVVSFAERGWL